MPALVIEINGADETGKTTQCALLGVDPMVVVVPARQRVYEKAKLLMPEARRVDTWSVLLEAPDPVQNKVESTLEKTGIS